MPHVGEAYLFDVEPALYLAEHDVVDAALISGSDDSGAFTGEQCEAQCGVLLVVPLRRLIVGVFIVGMENVQIFLILEA